MAASGDAAPAQLASLPARDGLVPADYLDLPQAAALGVNCLLSLEYPAEGGGLGDLPLGTGLLDEYEIGRDVVRDRVVVGTHNLLRLLEGRQLFPRTVWRATQPEEFHAQAACCPGPVSQPRRWSPGRGRGPAPPRWRRAGG